MGKSPMPKRVTLNHVAADADVSRATASLVVRGSELIAETTRKRVLASMQKLGYVYHHGAASLRNQTSQTIGLIIPDISNPFFAELTIGIDEELDKVHYSALLGHTAETLPKQERLLSSMQERRADGILLCPTIGTLAAGLEPLQRWRLPFVLVVRYLVDYDVDYVGVDNVLGARLATRYLLDRGHRRIAFVGGSTISSARRDRLRGYAAELDQARIDMDETLLTSSPVSRDGGYRAILELLHHTEPPTAAVCYNDVVAFGVMLGLQAVGRKPGRDFALVGFDNVPEAELWRPALTSIDVSARLIGQEAAKLLLTRIGDNAAPAQQIVMKPRLVVRDT